MSPYPCGSFPAYRLRRLRQSPVLRRLVCETRLSAEQLVLPLFARPGRRLRQPVKAMPGVCQLSPDELLKEAEGAFKVGVPAVLLFGIPAVKDAKAGGAYARDGIVQQAVRLLKKELPELLVITDVCLCEYMSHGHCGVVQSDGRGVRIANDPTLKLLARTAASHVEAGADMVAPSDMMDGRVRAIREELDRQGFNDTPIMAYAAKFASAFYGPFREAAESDSCCGAAGTYGVLHPETSAAIIERKMGFIRDTGATILATECPSCMMQLAYGAQRAGLDAEVLNVSQLCDRVGRSGER